MIIRESKGHIFLLPRRDFELSSVNSKSPVTVVEMSKACTVFALSEAGIVCSNPTQGMGV
jgi:hypothetical protein